MKRQEAVKAVEWFQSEVGIAGWTVGLHLGGRCPARIEWEFTPDESAGCYGLSLTDMRRHDIQIWLNEERESDSPGRDEDSLSTLMHELLHGAFEEVGIEETPLHEHLIDSLAKMLAELYRRKEKK